MLGALLLPVLAARAEAPRASGGLPPGIKTVEGFRVPEYDENGKKKSEIFGERADLLADGKANITGLKILLFKEGVQEGVVKAAQCVFDRADGSAISNTDVSIEKGNMKVTGRGFRYSAGGQRIEILNDVRVVLTNTKVWMKQEKH